MEVVTFMEWIVSPWAIISIVLWFVVSWLFCLFLGRIIGAGHTEPGNSEGERQQTGSQPTQLDGGNSSVSIRRA